MRSSLVLVASLVAASCAAAAAFAAPADDARAAADRFLDALIARDGQTACALISEPLLTAIGGPDKCLDDFSGDVAEDLDAQVQDAIAWQMLDRVYTDARALALARGGFVTKGSSLAALASDLRKLEPGLLLSVGNGPQAARNKPPFQVVIDRKTQGTHLVLYVESETGTIWRLDARGTARDDETVTKAGRGVPGRKPPEEPPTYTIGGALLADDATAIVTATLTYEGQSQETLLKMTYDGSAWKVADLYYSYTSLVAALEADDD
jgi:hypothetical protein